MDAAPGRGFDRVGGRINPRVAGALGSYRQPCRLGAIAPIELILDRMAEIIHCPAGRVGVGGGVEPTRRPGRLGWRRDGFFQGDNHRESSGIGRNDRSVRRTSGLCLDRSSRSSSPGLGSALSANGQPPRGSAVAPVEKILNRVARIVDRPAGSKGISGAGIATCRPSRLGGGSNAFSSDGYSEDRGGSRYADRREK